LGVLNAVAKKVAWLSLVVLNDLTEDSSEGFCSHVDTSCKAGWLVSFCWLIFPCLLNSRSITRMGNKLRFLGQKHRHVHYLLLPVAKLQLKHRKPMNNRDLDFVPSFSTSEKHKKNSVTRLPINDRQTTQKNKEMVSISKNSRKISMNNQ
jgi:hypothetical protein